MSHCIRVEHADGSFTLVNVADGVVKLPDQDLQALEQYIAYRKTRAAKKKAKK